MKKKKNKSRLYRVFQIFVVGLLLQFFVHTIVTYGLGLDGELRQVVWLWKELLIVVLGLWLTWGLITKQKGESLLSLRTLWKGDKIFRTTILALLGIGLYSLITTLFVNNLSLGHWIGSIKYNVFPIVIFLVRYVASMSFDKQEKKSLLHWLGGLLVVCLLLALVWYFVISTKAGGLNFFGYDNLQFEGIVGESPPAVYRTAWDVGTARNHFVFERPTVRGFYLLALWPLYFLLFLKRKSVTRHWFEWSLFSLNVFLTFSRAAWGVWLLTTIFLFVIIYRQWRKRIILGGAIGIVALGGLLVLKAGDGVLSRSFSDLGHAKEIVRGGELFLDKPLLGHGGSTAGPGSHQFSMDEAHGIISEGTTGFNPENQFLQWLIEYGLIGFVILGCFYFLMIKEGWKAYQLTLQKKLQSSSYEKFLLWARVMVVVGLLALFAEGMVLHSFADRMVVYPLFALMGVLMSPTNR